MNISKKLSGLFFCLIISYINNLNAMVESKDEFHDGTDSTHHDGTHGAPLHKLVHRAMEAMRHVVDHIAQRASQARDDKELVALLLDGVVSEVTSNPESQKKLGRLPNELSYDFIRGLRLAWAHLPESHTSEEGIRALRTLRRKLPKSLEHELKYGESYNKELFKNTAQADSAGAGGGAHAQDGDAQHDQASDAMDED